MSTALTLSRGGLDRYMTEVRAVPMLTRDEEFELARQFRDSGDVEAAHQLVTSNLRFVVKIAHQYKGYGHKMLDLVQEGNIGLMTAVKKFDPDRGYRLISYAVWWIRAHIQNYVMRSWSLVKLGSGRTKRKLFFKLRSERSAAEMDAAMEGKEVTRADLALRLGVDESDISDMELRMAGQDFSLDAPVGDDSAVSHLDMLSDDDDNQEDIVEQQERRLLLSEAITNASEGFNGKERYILDERLLSDEPQTLAEIGQHFGVSRERIRQLETRVLKKLKAQLPDGLAASALHA